MRPTDQSNRPAWPSGDDDALFVLAVLLLGGGVLGWLAWDTWRAVIAAGAIGMFRWQVSVLQHWTDRFDLADRQMAAADVGRVTLGDLVAMARAIGATVVWPAASLLVALAVPCVLLGVGSRYRRALNLDALAAEQATSFPAVAAFVGRRLRLVRPAPDPRPCDPALTPAEWIARHASSGDGSFDRDAAGRALAQQLGLPWRGPAASPPHVVVLAAAFALHLAQRRAQALDLLGAASSALAGGQGEGGAGPALALRFPKGLAASAAKWLVDPLVSGPALRHMGRHGHIPTALMGLLVEARRVSGVLPPAAFVWLRLVDRPLWHALASLGFKADIPGRYLHPNPRAEAAGARDHWAAERLAGHAIPEPQVERALAALEVAVRNRDGEGARDPSGAGHDAS